MSDQRYWCPQCGPDGPGNEDGCCVGCGSTAVGRGAELALWERQEMIRLRARVAKLEEVLERHRIRRCDAPACACGGYHQALKGRCFRCGELTDRDDICDACYAEGEAASHE